MKFSETPPPLRKEQTDIINHRWKQLYQLVRDSGQSAVQYLFLINAGGAATTLAFIGAVGANKIAVEAKISLAVYVFGVILLGIAKARGVHQIEGLFEQYKAAVRDFFGDKTTYEELFNADTERAIKVDKDFWAYALPYGSFGCFIIGSIIGFWALIRG